MKNLLKTSLLAILFAVSANAYAYDDEISLTVKEGKEKSVVFFVNGAQHADLTIYSATEEILFEEKIISETSRTRVYNLNDFPAGNYTVKLETENKIITYKVAIANGKTSISTATTMAKFRPVLLKENQTIQLDLENTEKLPVEVRVVDEHNGELYSRVYEGKSKLSTKFYVGKTDARELTFIIKSNNQEFIKTIGLR
jgi:hypothetical protein